MPCIECENGKWKWGSRGTCKYTSKKTCEQAHAGEHHNEGKVVMLDESLVKEILDGTAMVHKTFNGAIKGINEAQRTATFTISTGSVDRDNDTIDPEGWDLKDYRENPVVLWAHNSYIPPIAKSKGTAVKDGNLISTATFATREQHELADTVFRLVLGRFLNTASVGFRPKESVWNDDRGGFDFKKQYLHEWSIVPVPSNPEALVGAKEQGIDIAVIYKWASEALDMLACKTSARCELDSVWKVLSNPQIQVSDYQADAIDEALELASIDEGFSKALMVGLTGIDLDTVDVDSEEDITILQRDGNVDPEQVNDDEDIITLDEPVAPAASLDPGQAEIDLGAIEPDDLKTVIQEEIRTSLIALNGRLPD